MQHSPQITIYNSYEQHSTIIAFVISSIQLLLNHQIILHQSLESTLHYDHTCTAYINAALNRDSCYSVD